MKTSINFKAVKPDSEAHNFRRKTFDYIRKELTSKNEYWQVDKISDRIQKIEAYCKEKSGRKLQCNAMPVREAVVVIKEGTTLKDLHDLARKLEDELNIRIFQIAIHKDEGHWDKETKDWKPNLHAHLVADWQDQRTGKTLKHQSFHYSRMQDIASECLGMERGTAGSVGRLEAMEFKIKKKEEEYKVLEQKIKTMKEDLDSGRFKDLIIREPDFLGFKRIKVEKTIANYEKAFKVYNAILIKNKNELDSKEKMIAELQTKVQDLKKEVLQLKNKNSVLLTDSNIFAMEKKKYQNSVVNALEKSIHAERLLNPNVNRMDQQILLNEMNNICKEVAMKNNIPFSAFQEIFQAPELAKGLFALLSIGNGNSPEPEEIPVQKKKKKRVRR
ncbi:hypothetical protein [Chryseobacterium sp.]|uniref:hypothetical protein n=1 Tax=Chryseobacterium sp. TaxID=1871047 RepID=UPI003342E030